MSKQVARRTAVFDRPGVMDLVCAHITNGGNLVDLCNILDVKYHELVNFITGDDNRRRQYYAAISLSQDYCKAIVISELSHIARSDLRDLFNPDGSMKPPCDWPDSLARCVSSIEIDELFEGTGRERVQVGYTKKIKLWDKPKALELLGKSLALFTDKTEVSGKMTLEELVLGSIDGKTSGET